MLRHCQVLISFLLCIIVCHVHSIRMESFLSGMNFVGDARRSMGMIIPKAVTDNKPKSKLDPTLEKFYISEETIAESIRKEKVSEETTQESFRNIGDPTESLLDSKLRSIGFPKITTHFDPTINFKLKQRLTLLGACVTLGMDYLSDLATWRSYCAIEDSFVKGRFSIRGNELGWTKSWLWNIGLGDENAAKFKLRIGLNTKTYEVYTRLRFRSEPLSPFDIGEGLTCAGKLPVPLHILPMAKTLPFRIEYRLRLNAGHLSPAAQRQQQRRQSRQDKVLISTGLNTIDLSLDELNFCLEWDELSPVWGLGIVRTEPSRKGLSSGASPSPRPASPSSGATSSGGASTVPSPSPSSSSSNRFPSSTQFGSPSLFRR